MATKQGLASIGINVTVGESELNYVTKIGDIGGTPASLDATCFKDKMTHNVPGVQEASGFEIEFLFDNGDATSDYRVVKAMEDGKTHPVKIDFPDRTSFSNSGYINVKIGGTGVNELIKATITCSLQEDWGVTNPTT